MPESLPASTLAVLLLAVLAFVVDRLSHLDAPITAMAVFRRKSKRAGDQPAGAGQEAVPEAHPEAEPEHAAELDDEPEPEPATEPAVAHEPEAELAPARVQSGRPPGDYVPFDPPERASDADDDGRRLRDRLKRSMRKTRDYLNRDVREVFGSGPVEASFDGLEEMLVRADVGVATATALADELRTRGRELTSDTLLPALREVVHAQLKEPDRRLRVNPEGLSVWLIVGVNGSGKTTSVARLARLAKAHRFETCIAAADTFRAAAIEQLDTWAQRVGVDIVKQHAGADPAAVVFDAVAHAKAAGQDLVIADTAGRLHNRKPLMDELTKVRRIIDREPGALTECLLVLDATTGQNGIAQARAFADAADVTGLVLAKLDGTAKGGIVLAVERELGIPVKAVGIGEGMDDLAPFDPDAFVDALFGAD